MYAHAHMYVDVHKLVQYKFTENVDGFYYVQQFKIDSKGYLNNSQLLVKLFTDVNKWPDVEGSLSLTGAVFPVLFVQCIYLEL